MIGVLEEEWKNGAEIAFEETMTEFSWVLERKKVSISSTKSKQEVKPQLDTS